MPIMTRRTLAASAAALIVAASFAAAQAQQMSSPMAPTTPPVRIRATIETVNGAMLTAKSRDGAEMKVKLADNAPVNEVVKASLADIKDNSYIAVTAMPQPDGSQKAVAILIFPEAHARRRRRPSAVGPRRQFDHDQRYGRRPSQKQRRSEAHGEIQGRRKELHRDAGSTVIVTYKKSAASELKAGQKIFVAAAKKLDDGTLEAPNVAYGDVGVWR